MGSCTQIGLRVARPQGRAKNAHFSQCPAAATRSKLPCMSTLDKPRRAPSRDAANELYDRACDLLLAAEGIRTAAGEAGSAPAIAATLGCIEASLEALEQATAAMRREADLQFSARTAELATASGVSGHEA